MQKAASSVEPAALNPYYRDEDYVVCREAVILSGFLFPWLQKARLSS